MEYGNNNIKFFNSVKLPSILIVILNWNEIELTLRCIRSLSNQKTIKPDILIIDNNSDFNPQKKIFSEFPTVKMIRNKRNYGVAEGRNIGILYAINNNYKYVLLFDNDAYADSEMLITLLITAELHPNTGIFGPKILKDEKTDVIWRAGCTSWKWTYLHAGFEILNRFCAFLQKRPPTWIDTGRGENQKDIGQYDQMINSSFQIGCAQLIRTKVFNDVGLLDTDFSPYGSEDIDFCSRVSEQGWKIKYVPEAFCWHRSESSFKDNYMRNFFNARNIILLARKNLHPLYYSFLFIPDFLFLTLPLILIESSIYRQKQRMRGFIDGIAWNFRDGIKRGILLRKN